METRKTLEISLPLDRDSWHGRSSESIWTTLLQGLGDRTNVKAIVEVENIPFFSKSISLGDKLCLDFNTGVPVVDAVVERGGHSTYRIFVETPTIEASHMLERLKAMGCHRVNARFNGGELYAIDIPPEVDLDDAYEILDKGQREQTWTFEEGY